MSRLGDLQRFYAILDEVQGRLRAPLCLRGCHGRMRWPSRGVYFFFEGGERRSTSGVGPRVVRVGTHALTSTSTRTLWNRLAQHRGVATSGGGNHRGSIFRLLVGEALLQRDGTTVETWGVGGSPADAARAKGVPTSTVNEQERATEVAVSNIIGVMPFVFVPVDDPAGATSMRGKIERNAIALLSNLTKDPMDPPSGAWLGQYSAHERVRGSGLWNNRHVEEQYDASFLDTLAERALATTTP